jgi:ABC-2 type transport system permease protein
VSAPSVAIARRAFLDARVRNACYAALFALVAFAQTRGYASAYPTRRSRLEFAHAFAGNASVRLFYGRPYDLLTVGGYAAWRVGGLLAIFAGTWGILAAVRALRAEEDAGRTELVLASGVSRRGLLAANLAAICAGAGALWAATLLGLLAGRLPLPGSAYLALATLAPALVFVGVGALASQLAPTRRLALELAFGALALALLLRVVADTASGLEWLRWLTPLGWSEELRAFTGTQAAALVLPLAAGVASSLAAAAIATRRDVGSGILRAREQTRARLRLLSSPTALALREERTGLLGWLVGVGLFALIVGLVSTSVSRAGISASLQHQLQRLGGVSVIEPSGYIGFSFLFFLLAISLFCVSQLAAARHEEASERLETLFALPVGRHAWLSGRLALVLGGAVSLSLLAGMLAWIGAAVEGAGVSFASMLEAGLNCLPVALLFGSLAALAFALAPRGATGIGYGLVAVAFVWQLLSGLLGAPAWLRDVSPFEHVGLVPAQGFKGLAAIAMLGIAALCAAAAAWLFERRDLVAL